MAAGLDVKRSSDDFFDIISKVGIPIHHLSFAI